MNIKMKSVLILGTLMAIGSLTINAQNSFNGPVIKYGNKYAVTEKDGMYTVYSENGDKVFDVSTDYKINLGHIDSGYIETYRQDGLKTTGIYSLSMNDWIVEPGKSGNIYHVAPDRFAVEIAPNKYNYITDKGVILSTLDNIRNDYIQFESYGYFYDNLVKVISTTGKMGLLNSKTGKWIIPCQFDQHITFGGGKGPNKKFAVQQTSDKGELVTVYTVSGKKIASQFFPWGMRMRTAHIRTFGEKYLNH